MSLLTLLLLVTLFALFYILTGGEVPDFTSSRGFIQKYGPSLAGAIVFFLLGRLIFGTVLAALFWAILGWYLPPRVYEWLLNIRKKKLRSIVKSFIATASGLYSAGLTTTEVIRTCAERFPSPLGNEFQSMLGKRQLNQKSSYPEMFRALATQYELPEFNAVAAVIEAADRSGGSLMAARGFKRLSRALRSRDRLLRERMKNNYESLLAAVVAVLILFVGLVLDVTVLRNYFEEGAGKIILALSSGLIVGMTVVILKTGSSKDLV